MENSKQIDISTIIDTLKKLGFEVKVKGFDKDEKFKVFTLLAEIPMELRTA